MSRRITSFGIGRGGRWVTFATVIIDVQLSQANSTWAQYLEGVIAAQEAGFATVWVLDHLSGVSFDGSTMLECFTVLGAMAAATTTIGLGSLVVNAANRHPGMLATAAATVQSISGGRFVLGLGAGTSPTSRFAREQDVLGIAVAPRLADRHRHLADTLDLLDEMWSPARDSEKWQGFALPDPAPPVILGVNSTRLATIAGQRTNGVNVRAHNADRREVIAAAHDGRSGNPRPWTTSVWCSWDDALLDPSHPLRVELEADGVDRLILSWFAPVDANVIASAAGVNR